MPTYTYKCSLCGEDCAWFMSIAEYARAPGRVMACPRCGADTHRTYDVPSIPPMMHEHFNQSVGRPISDMRQYRDELKRKSDIASETTGIEHRYVPVDMNDRATLGVDGKGIDESNRAREKMGEPLLPDLS